MIRFLVMLGLFLSAACSVKAEPPVLFLHGQPRQGELIFGYATPGATVRLNGEKIAVRKDGWFVFGIGRDDTGKLVLTAERKKAKIRKVLKIKPRKWNIQRVDGVPQNTVTPNPVEQKRIADENALIAKARGKKALRPVPLCFSVPVKGRISGVYGSQRIFNGIAGGAHNALDIAAKTGTAIRAPADGTVLLAHEDMLLTGKTVLLAHGNDLTTSYVHMSKILVKEGQKLKKGDKIGLVGMTGRATGPHLHWTVMWKNKRVDPQAFMHNSSEFCSAPVTETSKRARKKAPSKRQEAKKAGNKKGQNKLPDAKADVSAGKQAVSERDAVKNVKNTLKGADATVPTKAGNASGPTANSGTVAPSSGGKQPAQTQPSATPVGTVAPSSGGKPPAQTRPSADPAGTDAPSSGGKQPAQTQSSASPAGTDASSSGGKLPVEKKSETGKPDGRKTVLKTSEKTLPRTQTTSENGK